MSQRAFVYIDGESHFLRAEAAWKSLYGDTASLTRLRCGGTSAVPMVLVHEKAKVFWTRTMSPGANRAVYYTSLAGDAEAKHDLSVAMRQFDLSAAIVDELKMLATQRANVLRSEGLIEKPKGVDIGLAVQMVEDAFNRRFDICHLYTSDIDFLPAIRSVRGAGFQVIVYGFANGHGKRSPFLHEPDLFVDLADMLKNECEPVDDRASAEGGT